MDEDKENLLAEIIVSILGLVILYFISVWWGNLFLKEGTSTIGFIIYFLGGAFLYVKFVQNLFSTIKKIWSLFKKPTIFKE